MPLYNPISNSDLIAFSDTSGNIVATNVKGALTESAVKIADNAETLETNALSINVTTDNANGRTVNVFNSSDLEAGARYATFGNVIDKTTATGWNTLKTPIKVSAGQIVYFNKAFQSSFYVGVDDSDIVRQNASVGGTIAPATVTVTAGVTKFYTSVHTSNSSGFMITINNAMPTIFTPFYLPNKRYGARYAMIGDSITWQDGQAYSQGDIGAISQGYGTLLKAKLGLSALTNYGISGASMARNSNYPTSGSSCIDGMTRDFGVVDLVTIACGTNDFKLNVALGTIGAIGDTEFDDTTFYGAYRTLIEYILTDNPAIKILLLTPLQRDNGSYDVNTTNSAGHKLIDYVNAIIAVGNMYGLPVLDLYAKSGITKLTMATFLMDGLHPNDIGYARMAELINPFVLNN